jgi:lambda repressor-like predicted transcriptional regulator
VAQADLRRVKTTARRLAEARTAHHAAILAARKSGESLRDIGKAAGVSHARIAQIVKGANRANRNP